MRFDNYHPAINFIYFVTAITGCLCFRHPVFLAVSYMSAFLYSVKLNGWKSFVFNIGLIPVMILYALFYASYNHFGITNLKTNFIGNQITLESLIYGVALSVSLASAIMFFSCMFAVVSTDKIIYLFGKISPRLSLFLAVFLRSVPRIKQRGKRIELSRKGVGRGCFQGNIFGRIKNCCAFVSILITWTIEEFMETASSMKSRGYTLKGRTAFSIYRFDNRDRCFVITIFLCLVMMAAAVVLDQTYIYYEPEIIMNRITAISWIFYISYAVLLLLPAILQTAGEIRFKQQQKKNYLT